MTRPMLRSSGLFFCRLMLCALATASAGADGGADPGAGGGGEPRWFKGNTHAHTELCGHADSSPAAVARWYLDRGYNFLCLSEHNRFIDPAAVELPGDRREDFILIPGEEVTGHKVIHTTALNIDRLVPWQFSHADTWRIIQAHVDATVEAGGTPILNHPNFRWAVAAADVLPVRRLHLFELYNGHPEVHNHGDHEHPGTEELWDVLLAAGMVIYGVSSDDAHEFKSWGADRSNPGRGWVMVRAAALNPAAITDALARGEFYASSGVILEDVRAADGRYSIAVDRAATEGELESTLLVGRRVAVGEPGCRIEAIGPGGEVVESVRGLAAGFRIDPARPYTRCKVTWTRPAGDGFEEFYAWTQPVFTDGRVEPASP